VTLKDELLQYDASIRQRVLERLPRTSLLQGIGIDRLVMSESIPWESRLTLLGSEMVGGATEQAVMLAGARFLLHLSQNTQFPDPYFGTYIAVCADNLLLDISLEPSTYHAVRGALDREAYNYWTGRFLEEAGVESSLEDYLDRQSMHTGSRFATATVVGALVARKSANILDAWGQFGHHVGMGTRLALQAACLNESSDSDHLTLPLLWVRAERPDRWPMVSGLIASGNVGILKRKLHEIGADVQIQEMIALEKAQAEAALQEIAPAINTLAYETALEILDALF
jgi:hypothetical protein